MEAATVTLDAERSRYDTGTTTLSDVEAARARLVESQSERAALRAALAFQHLLLRVAIGDGPLATIPLGR